MDQQQISAHHGMPTANEHDCMNCPYTGYMVISDAGDGMVSCPECDWINPT